MNKKKFLYKNGDKVGSAFYVKELATTYTRRALFKCKCGNFFDADISNVKKGTIKGCGCWRVKHGNTLGGRGKTKVSSEYHSYRNMLNRCYDPKNKSFLDYGGRGIIVCQVWAQSFENFIKDMGYKPTPKHTLERINTNGNYEPLNCKWDTKLNQARNKRNNVFYTYNGQNYCIGQWAEIIGISTTLLWHRLNTLRWDIGKAINTPVRKQHKTHL